MEDSKPIETPHDIVLIIISFIGFVMLFSFPEDKIIYLNPLAYIAFGLCIGPIFMLLQKYGIIE